MSLCRTCLSAEDLRDIFTNTEVNRRKEQLRVVTGVKISPNDGLPQKICNACSKLIASAVKLRETSAYTEKMLIQNGFQYNEQKLNMKNEKCDVKVKEEYNNDYTDLDFHDYDETSVKFEYNNVSDLLKLSRTTKRKHKVKKSMSKKKKTKTLNKNIPETSTYNIETDLLAPVSNDNTESLNLLNDIASMIPNHPTLDSNIQWIIKNIESKVQNDQKMQSVKTQKSNDDLVQIYELIDSKIDLIDTETTDSRCKSKPNKTISLEDELVEHLKKEDEKKPPQKNKTSTVDLDEIYNILDTKIDLLDIRDKVGRAAKEPTGKKKVNPRWSAERIKTFWSLAVEPFAKNERVQCKICHKFTKYSCFTRHAVTHFEPEFTCEVCGDKLMSKKNLSDHQQRKHGVTKNFACAQCDYRSVLPGELQNHVRRVHTGERPYTCDLCSESFYQRRCLVAHMRCHYAEKKYQCDRCSNMFKTQSALTAHYNRYHIMRYTFYCDHCSYQVSKSSKVKDHLTKVHGIPREKQAKVKFFKERREESLYGETSTKHLRKPEDIVKKISYKY